MKRSPLRRRVRVGQAARRRIQAGGKLAVGRLSQSEREFRATKVQLGRRSRGQCEVVLNGLRCLRRAVDACHVKKRSAGGSDDFANLYHGCRVHHEQEDAPFVKGRLCVQALGDGLFYFQVVVAPDKFALRG